MVILLMKKLRGDADACLGHGTITRRRKKIHITAWKMVAGGSPDVVRAEVYVYARENATSRKVIGIGVARGESKPFSADRLDTPRPRKKCKVH